MGTNKLVIHDQIQPGAKGTCLELRRSISANALPARLISKSDSSRGVFWAVSKKKRNHGILFMINIIISKDKDVIDRSSALDNSLSYSLFIINNYLV